MMYIEGAILKPNLQNIISGDAVTETQEVSEVVVETGRAVQTNQRIISTIPDESIDHSNCLSTEILESEQISKNIDCTTGQSSTLSSSSSSLSPPSHSHLSSSPSNSYSLPSKDLSSCLLLTNCLDSSKLKLKEEGSCNGDVELNTIKPRSTDAIFTKEAKIDEFLHLYDNLATFEDDSIKEEVQISNTITDKISVDDNFDLYELAVGTVNNNQEDKTDVKEENLLIDLEKAKTLQYIETKNEINLKNLEKSFIDNNEHDHEHLIEVSGADLGVDADTDTKIDTNIASTHENIIKSKTEENKNLVISSVVENKTTPIKTPGFNNLLSHHDHQANDRVIELQENEIKKEKEETEAKKKDDIQEIQQKTKRTVCLNNYISLYNDKIIQYRHLTRLLTESGTQDQDQRLNFYTDQLNRHNQMGLDFINKIRQLFHWTNTNNTVDSNKYSDFHEKSKNTEQEQKQEQEPKPEPENSLNQDQQNYQNRKRRLESILFNNNELHHLDKKNRKIDYLENSSNELQNKFQKQRSNNIYNIQGNINKSNILNNNAFVTNYKRMSKYPNQHAMPTNSNGTLNLRKSIFCEPQVRKRLVRNTVNDCIDLLDDDFLNDTNINNKSSNKNKINDDDDDTPILVNEYKLSNMQSTYQKRQPYSFANYDACISKDASIDTSARITNKKGAAPKPILLSSIQTSTTSSALPSTFLCGASKPFPNRSNNNDEKLSKNFYNNAFRHYKTSNNFMDNSTESRIYQNIRNRSVLNEEKHIDDIGEYQKLLQTVIPRLYGKHLTNTRPSGGCDLPTNCIGSKRVQESCFNIHSLTKNTKSFYGDKTNIGKLSNDQSQSNRESKIQFVSDRVPRLLPKLKSRREMRCDDDDVVFNGEFEVDRQIIPSLEEEVSKDIDQNFGWSHWRTSSSNNFPCVVQIDDDDDDDNNGVNNLCSESMVRKMTKPYSSTRESVIDLCKEPDNNFVMPRKPTLSYERPSELFRKKDASRQSILPNKDSEIYIPDIISLSDSEMMDKIGFVRRSKTSNESSELSPTARIKELNSKNCFERKFRHDVESSMDKTEKTDGTRKPSLPYVEPVNSLRERLNLNQHLQDNWLQQWRAKWSLHKQKRSNEVEETAKEAEKLTQERRLVESEIRDSLNKIHIVDPELIVLDDFADDVEEEPEFIDFNKQQRDIIASALSGPPDQVLITKFNMNITRRDIHTLCGNNWLNDEVINFYMNLLMDRGSDENSKGLPKVYAMNTFFVPRLIQGGHAGVKRWTRKVDIFSKDIIPVPVHVGGVHWCMAIIHLQNSSIKYYDSMGTPNHNVLSLLAQYLRDESMDKRKIPFDTKSFNIESVEDVPRQMNGSDCGVFSCIFAEYITRNKELTFSQQNMTYFRQRMILEIVQGKLLH